VAQGPLASSSAFLESDERGERGLRSSFAVDRTHITSRIGLGVAALASTLAIGQTATAASRLQFDVNAITTMIASNTGGGSFDENFTGQLRMGNNATSNLAALIIDGALMPVDGDLSDGEGWLLSNFTAEVNIENGGVIGGFLTLEAERYEANMATGETNTYEADVSGGAGSIKTQAGQGFTVDGLTINGLFSGATFAGIDVADFFALQPLNGSFLNFSFNPGADPLGEDMNSNIDIFVTVIPTPLAGLMGLAGLGALSCVRRRTY